MISFYCYLVFSLFLYRTALSKSPLERDHGFLCLRSPHIHIEVEPGGLPNHFLVLYKINKYICFVVLFFKGLVSRPELDSKVSPSGLNIKYPSCKGKPALIFEENRVPITFYPFNSCAVWLKPVGLPSVPRTCS